jgi:phosphatidylserine/phosphatidylglycerophosphate/cardiolipin synthase-like enzyme
VTLLARDIVRLAAGLGARHPGLDLFDRASSETLRTDQSVVAAAQRIPSHAREDPFLLVKLVVQALQLQRADLEPRLADASFVATLPGLLPIGTFGTAQVIADMLSGNAHEVVALGYEISADPVLTRLRELAGQGCRIVLLYDAQQTEEEPLRAGWPKGADVTLLAGRPDTTKARYAKMHGKALLVDGEDLLITSANLTFHGLEGNIELGIRLRGGAALDARRVLEHIASCGAFERRPVEL